MSGQTFPRRRGYSLIELVVVIAIMGVLFAMTLAAITRMRENALRSSCMNNMRNLGVAVLNYESTHGMLPPGAIQGPFEPFDVKEGVSHGLWALLLGQLNEAATARLYRLDLAYDHADNQPAVNGQIKVLQCPAAKPGRIEQWEPPPHFGGVCDYGPIEVNPFLADIALIDPVSNFGGTLPVNGQVRLVEITDGASTTLLLGEAGGRPGMAWSSPMNLLGLRTFFGGSAGLHRSGVNACMADGSVHFLRDRLDIRVLGRLATRAGGETIDEEF